MYSTNLKFNTISKQAWLAATLSCGNLLRRRYQTFRCCFYSNTTNSTKGIFIGIVKCSDGCRSTENEGSVISHMRSKRRRRLLKVARKGRKNVKDGASIKKSRLK